MTTLEDLGLGAGPSEEETPRTLGDLNLGRPEPGKMPLSFLGIPVFDDAPDFIKPIFTFLGAVNQRIAQVAGAPVELVDQAMRLAGGSVTEKPGDATRAVRSAMESVGIGTSPVDSFAADLGRNTFDSVATLAIALAAAPTAALKIGLETPGMVRNVISELGKLAARRPGLLAGTEAAAVTGATAGEREFGPTGALIGGLAGGLGAGGVAPMVKFAGRAIPTIAGGVTGAAALSPTGIPGAVAGAVTGGYLARRGTQAVGKGLGKLLQLGRKKPSGKPLFSEVDEDAARVAVQDVLAERQLAVTKRAEEISEFSIAVFGRQQGLVRRTARDLFKMARSANITISTKRLRNTKEALAELSTELQPFKDFPEVEQALKSVDTLRGRLETTARIDLEDVFTIRQLIGAVKRRAMSVGGIRLGAAKKVFAGISTDVDSIAKGGNLAGRQIRIFRAATKRAKLEFALRRFDSATAQFTKPVPGEEGVVLNARALRGWFESVTSKTSPKFDKNFRDALRFEMPRIRRLLVELEAGQTLVGNSVLSRFAGRDSAVAVSRLFLTPDPAAEAKILMAGLVDNPGAVGALKNQVMAQLFRRSGYSAQNVQRMMEKGNIKRLMETMLDGNELQRLEKITKIVAQVEQGKLKLPGVRRPVLGAVLKLAARFVGAGTTRTIRPGAAIQETGGGAAGVEKIIARLQGATLPEEVFALAVADPTFERLVLTKAPRTSKELQAFERQVRTFIGGLAGLTTAVPDEL